MARKDKLLLQNQKLNLMEQNYKGIPLNICPSCSYEKRDAIKFHVNHTQQCFWIPKKHLFVDGTIRPDADIDYVFLARDGLHKLELAHVYKHGIKKG